MNEPQAGLVESCRDAASKPYAGLWLPPELVGSLERVIETYIDDEVLHCAATDAATDAPETHIAEDLRALGYALRQGIGPWVVYPRSVGIEGALAQAEVVVHAASYPEACMAAWQALMQADKLPFDMRSVEAHELI